MDDMQLFPSSIPREEERWIRGEAARVRESGQSRAILLYGPGSVGKTLLVRHLVQDSAADPSTVWLAPIDIDDPEHWLLSNLELLIARQLDPDSQYFRPYLEYLSGLPGYAGPQMGDETLVERLGRIKRVFAECYQDYIQRSGKTVVMVFDGVEAIRGTYLLLTLTQWIKSLPGTLFILSGRPLPDGGDEPDPFESELEDPYQGIPVSTVHIYGFTREAAFDYLRKSGAAAALTEDEMVKLVHLTRGHPLWLVFTVAYLINEGIPAEAEYPLTEIVRYLPYLGNLTQAGHDLHEKFKRRLISPWQQAGFWSEAIRRLAVVRESVNEPIWQLLMEDQRPPGGVASLTEAWDLLVSNPLIRTRANTRYIMLHDVVADELAQRIIPLHDQDRRWRSRIWQRAGDSYREFTGIFAADLAEQQADLDRQQPWDALLLPEGMRRPSTDWDDLRTVRESARLDAGRREYSQLRVARLYYEILCDPAAGCRLFLDLLDQAREQHDILFQDLLASEMQRFLPGAAHAYAFGDVVGDAISEFRHWLNGDGRGLYLEVGLSLAGHLIRNERPEPALDLVTRLPEDSADHRQRYHISNLRGNACMRISGRVKDARVHFEHALQEARDLQAADRPQLIAAAARELGFYCRNAGLWVAADKSYQDARDAMLQALSARSPSDDAWEEMASIETNWAYVKGLRGAYRDGASLVESAIAVRHRLKKHQEEGISWSVCGEVYRYGRRFQKAWQAYAEAEQIFQRQRNWSWLGQVYQQQAICLYQASRDGIGLLSDDRDPVEQARRLIELSLDLCLALAVRGYPSALNRAGRIFSDEPDKALNYLSQGIEWAHRLSDGWFWFANLIEYAELCYRAWASTGDQAYRDQITNRTPEIDLVTTEYEFPVLQARWKLLRGHLSTRDWLQTGQGTELSAALGHYKEGFAQIAQECTVSAGSEAMAGEFKTFETLFRLLPPEIQAEWQDALRDAWRNLESESTLLARLDELT